MDNPVVMDEAMSYSHRLLAMGIGSIASLFAIGYRPPATYREAGIRMLAGCICAFAGTGFALRISGVQVNTDSVLATGLILGSMGWGILGTFVTLSESGIFSSVIKHWIQGKLPPQPPVPPAQ